MNLLIVAVVIRRSVVRVTPSLLVVTSLGALSCHRGVPLGGRYRIGPQPVHVSFPLPITPSGPERALCLRFSPPGGPRQAEALTVVLLTPQGDRDTLRGHPEHRGEGLVCLRDTSSVSTTRTYVAAEFSSAKELSVERISWAATYRR